jgi:hypothetical protein
MAASEPTPPIAIPTSARTRTGASSMPRLRRCRLRWSAWRRKDVNRYMKNYSYVFASLFGPIVKFYRFPYCNHYGKLGVS